MAYTRGMKRRGAPLAQWGAKRRRSRRTYPRRSYRGRRNSYVSSQRGNVSNFGYRSRRKPYRRYIKSLYNQSELAHHHRSFDTRAFTQQTGTANTLMSILAYPMVTQTFWNVGGGSVNPVIPDTDLFVRGGVCSILIRNTGDVPINCKIWKMVTTSNSANPFGSLIFQDYAWDPTVVNDFQKNYRILENYKMSIEPNDQTTLMHRLRPHKLDITEFNDEHSRTYWCVGLYELDVNPFNIALSLSHNLSFTADAL